MADLAKAAPKRKPRKAHEATVIGRRQISPDLVRLSMNSPAFVGKELEFTDHYIKLLFVPKEADYSWPFDIAQIRAEKAWKSIGFSATAQPTAQSYPARCARRVLQRVRKLAGSSTVSPR